jgi:hypothetical protein
MDKFFGKAIVIPCYDKTEITRELLQSFELKIAQVDFILFFGLGSGNSLYVILIRLLIHSRSSNLSSIRKLNFAPG